MVKLPDLIRNVFWEVGNNSALEYEQKDIDRLTEISKELKAIITDAKKRAQDRISRFQK